MCSTLGNFCHRRRQDFYVFTFCYFADVLTRFSVNSTPGSCHFAIDSNLPLLSRTADLVNPVRNGSAWPLDPWIINFDLIFNHSIFGAWSAAVCHTVNQNVIRISESRPIRIVTEVFIVKLCKNLFLVKALHLYGNTYHHCKYFLI